MTGILDRDQESPEIGSRGRSRRPYLLLFAAAAVLAALPVAGVRRPPILDLPQQLLQVDQARLALAGSAALRVRWESPNKIAAPLLLAARTIGGDRWGPRLAILSAQVVWIAAVFVLAARRRRSAASALLATLFLWSGTFYGGFLPFFLGIVALAVIVPELARASPERGTARLGAESFGLAALLYLTHALWLVVGVGLGVGLMAWRRAPAREWVARAVGAALVVALAAFWYPSLARGGWTPALVRGEPWTEILSSARRLATVPLGGLRGPLEPIVLLLVLLWLAAGAWGARRRRGEVDRVLLALGGVLLVAAIALPEVVGETTLFGKRWGWVAGICLVLAVPPPPLSARARSALAFAVVASLVVPTALVWRAYDRDWASGLDFLLPRIEPGDRVLGLDLVRTVPGLWVPPFPHAAAWAGLERGAVVGYTFAESPSSLVVHRELPIERGWTRWLHNRPDLLDAEDLRHFDRLLVVAPVAAGDALVRRFGLRVVAEAPPWRLLAPEGGRE